MTGGAGGATVATATTRSLLNTPTWALATVCFVFISVSIFIEHLIHLLSKWLKKHRKNALFQAMEKLKSVLMVLGFMSLILTVTQRSITKICIPNKYSYTMLPCRRNFTESTIISESSTLDHCHSKGMSSLISEDGLNQLNIFIFVLAVMQIVYCVLTMALGRAKMKRWKAWERETQTVEYLAANDPNRFRFTRQTTFGRRHMSFCTSSSFGLWIKCFFQQFFNSVAKVDYLTLRHGFISAHMSTNNSFNFQKYIQRSLEHDFKVVVGIRPFMWFLVFIFMLVDVHGWHVYLWVSFIPLIIVLVLGTKLQVIVGKMALKLKDEHTVIKGAPLVQPHDNHFWFNRPNFVLTLLHYTLFMNSFEVAFFVWVTWQYGITSCYHERTDIIAIRLVLAVTVQVMCSYITLPLYALVTQMRSTSKSRVILEEKTANAIRKWHAQVKAKRKRQQEEEDPRSINSANNSSSICSSKRSFSSPDLSSHHHHHHRSPTFADDIAHFPRKSEIFPETVVSSGEIVELKIFNKRI